MPNFGYRILALPAMVSLLFPLLASAQASSTWIRTGGPIGGLGYDIRVQPDNPEIMYVTDAFAGVHKSMDSGRNWVSINDGILDRTGPSNDAIAAFCLTIDPNNFNVIWVGLQHTGGIYRSANGGRTWERRTQGIAETNGFSIRGITIQAGNPNIVFAAGEIASATWAGQDMPGREFDRTKGAVYKSTDGGLNWRAVWRGDDLARYVLIDPANPNTVYVSTGIFDREAANSDPVANRPGGVGILKSSDGGQTWTQINSGLENLYVGSIFMHPQNNQVLLAGAGNNAYRNGGGIYLTTDGGAVWRRVGGTEDNDPIGSVEFSLQDPNIAYAGGSGSFFRSDDSGNTWRRLMNNMNGQWGPAGIRPGFPIDFQVDPRNKLRIFVNNYGGGNFLSADGGQNWTSSSDGYTGALLSHVEINPINSAVVYANGRSGPFKSMDGGTTWTGINPTDIRPIAEGARIAVDPQTPDHLLLSSAHWGWTFESTDAGATWRLVIDYFDELIALNVSYTGQRFQGVQAITFAPSSPQKVYAGIGLQSCLHHLEFCTSRVVASVLTSEDGGRNWRRHTGSAIDGFTVSSIVVHPIDSNTAWAGTMGGVFRTSDGGVTWQPVSSGLTDLKVLALVQDVNRPDTLYAGTTSRGVFKSVNGGASWTAAATGMAADETIGALALNRANPDTIYAGSWTSGIYVSTNGGSNWALLNNGLRTRSVRALSISSDGSVVYAATEGEGVFRLGDIVTGGVASGTSIPFLSSTRQALSLTTQSTASSITAGYARIQSESGRNAPAGVAIFGFRQGGVLVSEAGVPASPLIRSGRIYAEVGSGVNTGVAIANPNSSPATLAFYFTNSLGVDTQTRTATVPASGQIAAFLDQPPFGSAVVFNGSFSFTSTVPISVIALRGLRNERSEFLLTTLPVVDLASASSSETLVFPHFADGAGWTTQIVLINPAEQVLTGNIQFVGQGTTTEAAGPVEVAIGGQTASSFAYSIPARTSIRLRTAGASDAVRAGTVRVTPSSGQVSPSGLGIFSYRSGGVTVSEAGIPAVPPAAAYRIYAEGSGNFNEQRTGSIQTGLAIANSGASNATVSVDLTDASGNPVGASASVTVPASGQVALFLNQISGLGPLPANYQGVLRVATTGSSGVSVIGIRGRYNERSDFLITTTPASSEAALSSNAELAFPHFAVGGGYSTQFIIYGRGGVQTSAGLLRFFGQTGQSLNLVFH